MAFDIIGSTCGPQSTGIPSSLFDSSPGSHLEPPAPQYGLSIPPLNEGGWWLLAGFLPTAAILFGGGEPLAIAQLGMSNYLAWAFGRYLALPGSGILSAPFSWAAGAKPCHSGFSPTLIGRRPSHAVRQPVLQPVPHAVHCIPLWLRRFYSPCTAQRFLR